MKKFVSKWLPAPETIHSSRLLRWLGPLLHRPWLWQFNRRTVPKSVAIGVFWGFLIPVLQSIGAVVCAIVFRANIPVAVFSTLISNPFTYAPIFLLAYQLGTLILGQPIDPASLAAMEDAVLPMEPTSLFSWHAIGDVAKPMFLGLFIFAVVGAIISYFLTIALWRVAVTVRLNRKQQRLAHGRTSQTRATRQGDSVK
jgi:uncharacterized protein